jgi:hypothetical protein
MAVRRAIMEAKNTKGEALLFSEKQRFSQWWLWLLLFVVDAFVLFHIYKQVSDNIQRNVEPWIAFGIVFAITILIYSIRLETRITKDGIYVRFFPFHLKFQYYSWPSMSKAFVRKYRPIGEYGGWGIRFSINGNGRAFNVSGNIGLQLDFLNNKRLLIGTNKADELTRVLSNNNLIG